MTVWKAENSAYICTIKRTVSYLLFGISGRIIEECRRTFISNNFYHKLAIFAHNYAHYMWLFFVCFLCHESFRTLHFQNKQLHPMAAFRLNSFFGPPPTTLPPPKRLDRYRNFLFATCKVRRSDTLPYIIGKTGEGSTKKPEWSDWWKTGFSSGPWWERFRRMRGERESKSKVIQIRFFCRHPRNWGIGRGQVALENSFVLSCCAITRSKLVGRVQQRDGRAIPAISLSQPQPRRTDSPFTWTDFCSCANLFSSRCIMTQCWCTHVSAYMCAAITQSSSNISLPAI